MHLISITIWAAALCAFFFVSPDDRWVYSVGVIMGTVAMALIAWQCEDIRRRESEEARLSESGHIPRSYSTPETSTDTAPQKLLPHIRNT